MKNNKSPGELFKDETDQSFKHLTLLFQECISTNKIPEKWKHCLSKYDNYRGTVVTGPMGRIYGKILKKGLQKNIK